MRIVSMFLRSRLVAPVAVGLAALCFAGTAADAERSAPMIRQQISVPGFPNALCNDGTLPIVYFQAGTGDDRNKWVIYLQGGGGCATDTACADRAKGTHDLVSSDDVNLPTILVADGILSTVNSVNPDFAGYTHVFVHYCSSDAYAGDAVRTINGASWQFRGKDIITATLKQLSAPSDAAMPSLKDATEVLVTGGSAGAMGVHNNLDRIAALLAPIKVKGIADSGWVPYGIKPFAPGTMDVRPDAPAALAYYNGQPDNSCVAANPDKPGDCLNQNFAFPYITTPMFVYADQRDPSLLGLVGIITSPTTVAETNYTYEYARQVRESLAAKVPAYFAPDVKRHQVLLNTGFAATKAGTETLGAALHAWYFGTADAPVAASAPPPETTVTVK